MKKKAFKSAVCAVLSLFLFTGCSYFPAEMPDIFPTGTQASASAPGSTTQTETAAPSASTAPSEATEASQADKAVKAYTDFISGKTKVSTAGCFEKDGGRTYLDLAYGTYTFDEMKKAVRFDSSFGSTARYAVVDCGKDGLPELAVSLEMLDRSSSSVICLIGYADGNLVMNAMIEEKVPNEYRLYDGGYLESSVIPVKGTYRMVLIRVESGGKCSEVFTYNEFTGSSAANIIKHLSRSEEESAAGFEGLTDDFMIREFISDGTIVISAGRWSASETDRALEEKFVSKLKDLGAEEVSEDKMKELTSTKEYTAKEVTWTDCGGNSESTSSVGIAAAAGRFSLTIYQDPQSPEYAGLGNVVHALNSGTGTDMRFVSDSDEVTVILEKGSWDMNTDTFAAEKEIFSVQAKAGVVYQFNCVPGDVFPYYRLRAVKGNFTAEWLVLGNKSSNKVTVIKSSINGA